MPSRIEVLKHQADSLTRIRTEWHVKMYRIRAKIDNKLSHVIRIRPCDYEKWQFAAKRVYELGKCIRSIHRRREALIHGGRAK